MKLDVSWREFLEFMCQYQLIVMSLDTEGQQVWLLFNKRLQMVRCQLRRIQVGIDRLSEIVEDWKNKNKYYLQYLTHIDACAMKFKNYLENECSEEK